MSLQPGDLLKDQYRIERLLGRGGFGFVYLAQDTLLREDVAIKELIPALIGDEGLLKRFLAEAKATIRLTHERIVRTHAVFSERGNYYIVMEYLAGGSLEERLKEHGALPVDEAVHVAADVAEGLSYAHEHGVVHCDLKPANVLFTADGHAKIADFGIAHVPREMFSRSWATASGFVAGTLPYMSPEQADGVRDDPRADLYALGAVLYRTLTDRTYLDFDLRDTPGAQARNVQRIQAELPAPPSSHNRRVPGWLDAVVLRALAKRPEDRYASANELLAALARKGAVATSVPAPVEAETVVVPSPPRAAPVHPRPQPQPLPFLRWLWPAVGGAAVLLIAVIVALAASIPTGDKKPTPTAAPAMAQITVAPNATVKPPTMTSRPTETPPMPKPTATPAATATSTSLPTASATPTATATATPMPKPMFTVTEPTINVRDGPDTVYQVIGTLRQGETFEITGRSQAGDWWQFTYNGKPAWVSGSVVNINSQAAGAPMVAAPPTPKPSLGIGSAMVSDKDGMVLVYVPAGEFLMGSADDDSDADSEEKPQHKATLDAFWIDRTEVTNAQYRKCVEAGACQPPSDNKSFTRSSYYDNSQYENYPVIWVSWNAAQKYCQWANRRLPTEAEWEKAARGTDGRKYPWGDDAPDNQRANFNGNKSDTTAAGSYPTGVSPYGVLDMAGNVWEWTADWNNWYNHTYYASAPVQNPKGPDSGQSRVLRGGSWNLDQRSVRAACRGWLVPDGVDVHIGFRCAHS